MAFAVTILSSSSVLLARVTRGALSVEWLTSAVLIFSAIACATSLTLFARPRSPRAEHRADVILAHGVGALLAVGVVHAAVAFRGAVVDAALVERPTQLVNDLVLSGVILGLCWSLDGRTRWIRLGLPVACLTLVALYVATASRWHVDSFPGFVVQRYVAQQCLTIAAALVVFDLFRPIRDRAA